MPDLYLGIVRQSAKNLNMPANDIIPNSDVMLSFLRDLYNYTNEKTNVVLMTRSVEFQSYGVIGAPGGETLADMVWNSSHMSAFIAKMINAQTGFIIGGPAALFPFAAVVPEVYTANTTTLGLSLMHLDTSEVNNVTTLGWNEIRNSMPQVDIVSCYLNVVVDYDILNSLLTAVKPGGIFLLANASNGSEMYHSENTFPEEVHSKILETGDFFSFHMQGYLSYSCFIKK